MRSLGLSLIVIGSLATVGAMFLPSYSFFGGDSLNSWEAYNGLDVALVVACAGSVVLALLALTTGRHVFRQLAGLAGAVTFGLAFAVIPGTIDTSEGARAGIWVVAGAAAIALAGAVIVSVANPD
jgi:hypothetical protein